MTLLVSVFMLPEHARAIAQEADPIPTTIELPTSETPPAPNAQQLIQQGLAAQEAGRYREAVSVWRLLLSTQPNNATAQNSLGNALVALGQIDNAESAYRSAVRIAPDEAMGYYNLGTLLAKRSRIEEAIAAYQE
ncbi:MAG: tetratricopeptide repeat protein, partial [Cyanobacteria bacterium J06560_2]